MPGFVTRLTRRAPLVEQELLTLVEHLSSHPGFCWVRVTRSLVLCVMFCRSLFVPLPFFFRPFCCLFFDLRILITSLVSYLVNKPHFVLPSFFDLRILITSLVSSNYSYIHYIYIMLFFFFCRNIFYTGK